MLMADTACRIDGSECDSCNTSLLQNFESNCPSSFAARLWWKKSRPRSFKKNTGWFCVGGRYTVMTFRDGAVRTLLYTHFRLPTAQRRHIGFASSHFTRRALQVLHPVRTLDVLSRVLFSARSRQAVIMNDAVTKSRFVILRHATMKQ